MSRKTIDAILKFCIYASSAITVGILVAILGFLLIKGLPGLSFSFLTRNYENETAYVTVTLKDTAPTTDSTTSDRLGITLAYDEKDGVIVSDVQSDSVIKNGLDLSGVLHPVKKGDALAKVGDVAIKSGLEKIDTADSKAVHNFLTGVIKQIDATEGNTLVLKVVRPGGGILPMLITTVYMILLSILIAGPIGILSAVFLNEYAKRGKLVTIIHFAIENLAGIPSIIYGLFGSLFFVQICHLQYSILAGALTISIILLPTIITTTEEALKTIPRTYRESSLGLGATKLQTIGKVILPNAIPGILVAVILSIGRVVGESAALLLTAGTVAQIPKALFGNSASGATLTIKAYTLMKEENDLTTACAIGIVLIIIIVLINITSKKIANHFIKKRIG